MDLNHVASSLEPLGHIPCSLERYYLERTALVFADPPLCLLAGLKDMAHLHDMFHTERERESQSHGCDVFDGTSLGGARKPPILGVPLC